MPYLKRGFSVSGLPTGSTFLPRSTFKILSSYGKKQINEIMKNKDNVKFIIGEKEAQSHPGSSDQQEVTDASDNREGLLDEDLDSMGEDVEGDAAPDDSVNYLKLSYVLQGSHLYTHQRKRPQQDPLFRFRTFLRSTFRSFSKLAKVGLIEDVVNQSK